MGGSKPSWRPLPPCHLERATPRERLVRKAQPRSKKKRPAPHQHAVVQLCAALLVVKHAPHVQLEGPLVSLNGHGNRLLGGGLLQGNLEGKMGRR